jgi:hypothetical protein
MNIVAYTLFRHVHLVDYCMIWMEEALHFIVPLKKDRFY